MSTSLKLKYNNSCIEVGCDEAGRGCIAGPVFAAAVILPDNFDNNIINDSKQLSDKKRRELRDIIENKAIAWAIGICDNNEIDKINILNASIRAMHKALDKLEVRPEQIIVDGNRFKKYKEIPSTTIVKGDSKYMSIAAASILAKTYRDDYMNSLNKEFPQYYWSENKGYPTQKHREAIRKSGISKYHRRSFNLTEQQLKINFNL